MLLWWALGFAILGGTVALVAARAWRAWRAQRDAARVPPELVARRAALRARLVALAERMPERPALVPGDLPALPGAAAVEAHLLAGEPKLALAAAEQIVAGAPSDPGAHALLARALLYGDALAPAAGEIARARELGGADPVLDYVEGLVEHLLWLRKVNPGVMEVQTALVPPLVTPFDRVVLGLARQRQGTSREATVWMATGGREAEAAVDPEAAARLLAQHVAVGERSLGLLLNAAEAAPGSAERLYHTARRALQLGFVAEGRRLMERLEPLVAASGDARELAAYQRDRADLDGRVDLPPDPPVPPTPPGAKRSSKLVILGK